MLFYPSGETGCIFTPGKKSRRDLMLRELLVTLMDCRGTNGNYLFAKGRFVRRGFSADPSFELTKSVIIKDSRTTTTGCAHGLFLKRYNSRGIWRTLKRSVQLPRAYECLAAALRLQQAGIATPEVLLASRYYLITEALPEGTVFLNRTPELTADAADVIAKMHDSGIYHGDLNLRNIYFLDGKYGFIDLDSAKLFPKGIPKTLRRKDMARLVSSCAIEYIWCGEPLSEEELEEFTNTLANRYRMKTGAELGDPELKARIQYLIRRKRRG